MIETPEEKAKRRVRQLIWIYFWLLLIEGALRKWVVPQLSNPILLIRDPVMLAIYYYALRGGVFPKNFWVNSLWIIGVLSLIGSLLFATFNLVTPYAPVIQLAEVALYGVRTNFFHLPLIFVIANVFDEEDVKKFGWWILLLMVPMSLLMVAQFQASPDSFINRTAGLGEAEQLTAGGGKIRPPGTFSFISGPVFYMSVASAFLIYGALSRGIYKNWLLMFSAAALVVGIAVSGSKSAVASVLLVVLAVGVILIFRPRAVNRLGWTLVIIVLGAIALSYLPIFKEGVKILSDRFTSAAEAAETTVLWGMIDRVIGDFTEGFQNMDRYPLFGYGLGLGTNVAGRVLFGHPMFLLAEREWTRVLGESGLILGLLFLSWRTLLTLRLAQLSFRALKCDSLLPILLFGCSGIVLLNGQLGQSTTLGFAVLLNGLCLASTRPGVLDSSAAQEPPGDEPPVKRIPRRSVFADRLHQPGIGAEHDNGSVDR